MRPATLRSRLQTPRYCELHRWDCRRCRRSRQEWCSGKSPADSLELSDRGFIAVVMPSECAMGSFEDLSLLRGVGERRVRLLDAECVRGRQMKRRPLFASSRREQAACTDLEAVADAKYHSALFANFSTGLHHRRKTRDGAVRK